MAAAKCLLQCTGCNFAKHDVHVLVVHATTFKSEPTIYVMVGSKIWAIKRTLANSLIFKQVIL